MEQAKELQTRIAQALIKFAEVHLRIQPRAALVDVHEHRIVVTLEDVVPPVERDYARDSKGHELLDKSYAGVFECTRQMAETELEQILGRAIKGSIMRVDPASGNALMVFSLAEA
jgi:uncharacterized protein YbcI